MRFNFFERLSHSYVELFNTLKEFHISEMTKYNAKLNALENKERVYQKIIESYKEKEQFKHTDILGLNKKLDTMEKEINISSIFKKETDQQKAFIRALEEKAMELDYEGKPKNASRSLHEIFKALISVKHGSGLLQTLGEDSVDFDIENWEGHLLQNFKKSQFGTAKSVVDIFTNRDKFKEVSIQTENDPMKKAYRELEHKYEQLQMDFRKQKDALDYANKKTHEKRLSIDEEKEKLRKKELELEKMREQYHEAEAKLKKNQHFELEFHRKIARLQNEVERKHRQMVESESSYKEKIQKMESDEYILERIEQSIRNKNSGEKGAKGGNNLYDAFMKMNLDPDADYLGDHSQNGSPRGGSRLRSTQGRKGPHSQFNGVNGDKTRYGTAQRGRNNRSKFGAQDGDSRIGRTGRNFNKNGRFSSEPEDGARTGRSKGGHSPSGFQNNRRRGSQDVDVDNLDTIGKILL